MRRRGSSPAVHPTARLIGESPAISTLRVQIRTLAAFDTVGNPYAPTLLLHGETGTGKGLVARLIHDSGPRADGPFIEVNCAAIPETMLEAELFGFEAGAFTDARRAKPGLFEAASGGTLFLDEIDALPLVLQAKLLTAIEEKRIRRLGTVVARQVDVKIIAATQADLQAQVAAARFRPDLYHRLTVVVVELPPLRERDKDILVIAEHYLRLYATAHHLTPRRLNHAAKAWLLEQAWPGNVRELSHLMERATLLHPETGLDPHTLMRLATGQPLQQGGSPPATGKPPDEAARVRQALVQTEWNVVGAARLLGLSRSALRYRMRKYGITPTPQPTVPQEAGREAAAVSGVAAPPVTIPETVAETPRAAQSGASLVGQQSLPGQHTSGATAPAGREVGRRQLTVMFCDLVNSSALATRLDPEDYYEVIRAYQDTCARVIQEFAGQASQYLGDGVLAYFGYPLAHEDDAHRAVRAGLRILEALVTLNRQTEQDHGVRLAARLAIHTGLVIVGDIERQGQTKQLAFGETLNIAARLQEVARPDTVILSAATYRLVEGYVVCDAPGTFSLKGILTPVQAYRVLRLSDTQSRLEVAAATTRGLTPLVGRESEMALLHDRWTQAREGRGQVILLSGEAGIGKSRLAEGLRTHVLQAGGTSMVLRCSPYTTNSAFHPIIEHLRMLLQFQPDDTPEAKLDKLEQMLLRYSLAVQDMAPLFASLLSVPQTDRYPPLQLSPERQKQKTCEALQAWFLREAEQHPLLVVWEDLHWADPSTLEFLLQMVDQVPTASLLVILTFRPELQLPEVHRSYFTHLTLGPLGRPQVEAVMTHVAGGRRMPIEVGQHVMTKTAGAPLFVEEMTKALIESGLVQPVNGHYELILPLASLAIPATLQDTLMARLDHLGTAKHVLQFGATLGRQFSYALLQAVTALDNGTLQRELQRLVGSELLYQRGAVPQATYVFKHSLLRDAAYQALLRRTRQQYHQRIAQVITEQFPDMAETQPELLAHHYTEAGLGAQAVRSWQQAGQRAVERSANVEAINHFTRGLEVLKGLPETSERIQQELTLQLALGSPLLMLKGQTAPEVQGAYNQALTLCQQLGEEERGLRFSALAGLWRYYITCGRFHKARELGEQCLLLAQSMRDLALLQEAHIMLGSILLYMGELQFAREHLEQGAALYDPELFHSRTFSRATDLVVLCLSRLAWALWLLGYPTRAWSRVQEALTLAGQSSHIYSMVIAKYYAAMIHQCRGEAPAAQEQAEAVMAFSQEHGFVMWSAEGRFLYGWALAQQSRVKEGIAQMRESIATLEAMEVEIGHSSLLTMLAAAYGASHQTVAGRCTLAEAQTLIQKNAEGYYAAELTRLSGDLLLQESHGQQILDAEQLFQQARSQAARQHAKSFELRAAMSLARLWNSQGRRAEAHHMLAETYGWFTEGNDTRDLQQAKALLDVLQ